MNYIKNNEKKWKGEVFKKFWIPETVGLILGVFVEGAYNNMNSSYENILLHVKQRIEGTKDLLKILLVKRQELSTFEEVFVLLKKDFDLISEKLYQFYLFNIKHFVLHNKFVTYDLDKEGRQIEIGRGAFGTVYKGKLEMKNIPTTRVAIKELNIKSVEDNKMDGKLSIQDLISEEDALLQLSCPQVISYYGCYLKKVENKITTLNLVMRLADGGLDGLINNAESKPYTDNTVISLSKDIALGMNFIHSKNWIHRDLKPANILISDGHAMITDLGLCKPVESLTNTICGTPLYMAP